MRDAATSFERKTSVTNLIVCRVLCDPQHLDPRLIERRASGKVGHHTWSHAVSTRDLALPLYKVVGASPTNTHTCPCVVANMWSTLTLNP